MNLSADFYNNLSDEDKLLVSRINDLAAIADNKFIPKFSFFLDERQTLLSESVLKKLDIDYKFWGGFDKSSRKILGVFPKYYDEGNLPEKDFPVASLTFNYRSCDVLTHRDFLGSFMSKQIARNLIGDIIVNNGFTIMFVYSSIADMLLNECSKIGSVGVKINKTNNVDNIIIPDNFLEINGTVSSLRLDCLVSLATKLSREKSTLLIRNGAVSVFYEAILSSSKILSQGDIFSIRGYGKFILDSVGGKSKKDRIHICIKKYV